MMKNNFLKNANVFLDKAANILRRHYLLVVLLAFISSLIIAGFIFYYCIWLVINLEPEVKERKIEIKEDVYRAILENIDQREKRFLEYKNKVPPDIFSESLTH